MPLRPLENQKEAGQTACGCFWRCLRRRADEEGNAKHSSTGSVFTGLVSNVRGTASSSSAPTRSLGSSPSPSEESVHHGLSFDPEEFLRPVGRSEVVDKLYTTLEAEYQAAADAEEGLLDPSVQFSQHATLRNAFGPVDEASEEEYDEEESFESQSAVVEVAQEDVKEVDEEPSPTKHRPADVEDNEPYLALEPVVKNYCEVQQPTKLRISEASEQDAKLEATALRPSTSSLSEVMVEEVQISRLRPSELDKDVEEVHVDALPPSVVVQSHLQVPTPTLAASGNSAESLNDLGSVSSPQGPNADQRANCCGSQGDPDPDPERDPEGLFPQGCGDEVDMPKEALVELREPDEELGADSRCPKLDIKMSEGVLLDHSAEVPDAEVIASPPLSVTTARKQDHEQAALELSSLSQEAESGSIEVSFGGDALGCAERINRLCPAGGFTNVHAALCHVDEEDCLEVSESVTSIREAIEPSGFELDEESDSLARLSAQQHLVGDDAALRALEVAHWPKSEDDAADGTLTRLESTISVQSGVTATPATDAATSYPSTSSRARTAVSAAVAAAALAAGARQAMSAVTGSASSLTGASWVQGSHPPASTATTASTTKASMFSTLFSPVAAWAVGVDSNATTPAPSVPTSPVKGVNHSDKEAANEKPHDPSAESEAGDQGTASKDVADIELCRSRSHESSASRPAANPTSTSLPPPTPPLAPAELRPVFAQRPRAATDMHLELKLGSCTDRMKTSATDPCLGSVETRSEPQSDSLFKETGSVAADASQQRGRSTGDHSPDGSEVLEETMRSKAVSPQKVSMTTPALSASPSPRASSRPPLKNLNVEASKTQEVMEDICFEFAPAVRIEDRLSIAVPEDSKATEALPATRSQASSRERLPKPGSRPGSQASGIQRRARSGSAHHSTGSRSRSASTRSCSSRLTEVCQPTLECLQDLPRRPTATFGGSSKFQLLTPPQASALKNSERGSWAVKSLDSIGDFADISRTSTPSVSRSLYSSRRGLAATRKEDSPKSAKDVLTTRQIISGDFASRPRPSSEPPQMQSKRSSTELPDSFITVAAAEPVEGTEGLEAPNIGDSIFSFGQQKPPLHAQVTLSFHEHAFFDNTPSKVCSFAAIQPEVSEAWHYSPKHCKPQGALTPEANCSIESSNAHDTMSKQISVAVPELVLEPLATAQSPVSSSTTTLSPPFSPLQDSQSFSAAGPSMTGLDAGNTHQSEHSIPHTHDSMEETEQHSTSSLHPRPTDRSPGSHSLPVSRAASASGSRPASNVPSPRRANGTPNPSPPRRVPTVGVDLSSRSSSVPGSVKKATSKPPLNRAASSTQRSSQVAPRAVHPSQAKALPRPPNSTQNRQPSVLQVDISTRSRHSVSTHSARSSQSQRSPSTSTGPPKAAVVVKAALAGKFSTSSSHGPIVQCPHVTAPSAARSTTRSNSRQESKRSGQVTPRQVHHKGQAVDDEALDCLRLQSGRL